MSRQVKKVNISGKEDKSNKVTSLSENSTNTQYPSAKTVYDELMTVRTVTPPIFSSDNSGTFNNVTKNWHYLYINSSDLEYFEKIIYNITFEDDDFQMFYQYPNEGVDIFDTKMIYFDGTDCYWGIPNNEGLTKGSLICEGNTIQATLNKDRTVTIGNTITNWDIRGRIFMFGDVDFTYTIYSHKYLDSETFPYVFEDQEADKSSYGDNTHNSITKDSGGYYFDDSSLNNIIETTYTFTFNDNDFSCLQIDYDYTIFFDGTDCYWGSWDYNYETGEDNLVKGNLICEGNVVQAVHKSTDGSNEITFSDGTSTYFGDEYYFGDVSVKRRNKAPRLEYATNKTNSISGNYDEYVAYPNVSAIKDYAENKSDKVTSWSSTTTNTHYPSEKLVKDSLDGKQEELVSGTNLKTLNGVDLLGEGDIAIDVSCGEDSTVIFEDDCSSATGLTHYGNDILLEGGSATTMTYDSTENAYQITTSDTKSKCIPIDVLTDVDNFKFEADIKPVSLFGMGFGVSGGTGNGCVISFSADSDNLCGWKYTNGSFGTLFSDVSGLVDTGYLHITVTVTGTSLDVSITDTNNTTRTATATLPSYSTRYVGIGLGSGTSNQTGYIKNIKVETLGGGSTVIFEDECSSSVNIGEYGAVKSIYGSTTTGTIEYNSQYDAYALNRTGTSSNSDATIMFPITSLTGLDNFTIEADIQSQHIAYNRVGFGCVDSDGNTAFFTIGHDAWSSALRFFYGNHSSITAIADDESFTQQWYHIVVNVQGNSYLADLYLSDTKIASVNGSYSLDITTRDVGIMLGCPSNSTCWVKNMNINAESLNGGLGNTIYLGDDIMTMIDSALGHMITNWEDYE